MWEIIAALIGFAIGYACCVLFRISDVDKEVAKLRKTNAALVRRLFLLEQVYQPRRIKKVQKRIKLKKSCDKGKCDGSCK